MFLYAVFPVFFPPAVFGNGNIDIDINSLLSTIEPFRPLISFIIVFFLMCFFIRFCRSFYRCFLGFDDNDIKKCSPPNSVLKVPQQHPNSFLKAPDKQMVSLHKNNF